MKNMMELVDPMTMRQLPCLFCCKVGPIPLISCWYQTVDKVSDRGAGWDPTNGKINPDKECVLILVKVIAVPSSVQGPHCSQVAIKWLVSFLGIMLDQVLSLGLCCWQAGLSIEVTFLPWKIYMTQETFHWEDFLAALSKYHTCSSRPLARVGILNWHICEPNPPFCSPPSAVIRNPSCSWCWQRPWMMWDLGHLLEQLAGVLWPYLCPIPMYHFHLVRDCPEPTHPYSSLVWKKIAYWRVLVVWSSIMSWSDAPSLRAQ